MKKEIKICLLSPIILASLSISSWSMEPSETGGSSPLVRKRIFSQREAIDKDNQVQQDTKRQKKIGESAIQQDFSEGVFAQHNKEFEKEEIKTEQNIIAVLGEEEQNSKQWFFTQHNKKFKQEEIKELITKGQNIISDLLRGESPEIIFNKYELKIFADKGSKFATRSKGISFTSFKNKIVGGRSPEETYKRQKHLESILAVAWAIAYAPCVKDEKFKRGSFSIKDDDKLLSKFLDYYALEASYSTSTKIEDLSFVSSSNFAYGRTNSSSHYPMQTLYQVGIDARFENNAEALSILPFNNTHILFGRVHTQGGKEKTFFKLEGHGLGDMWSALQHGKEYADAIDEEQVMRREKDILPSIKQSFGHCIEDLIGWNKKTKEVILAYENLQSSGEEWESSSLAIAQMADALKDLSQAQRQQEQPLQSFLNLLSSHHYLKEDVNYRTGNEVILSLENIEETIAEDDTQ